jgi:hypothetical protein
MWFFGQNWEPNYTLLYPRSKDNANLRLNQMIIRWICIKIKFEDLIKFLMGQFDISVITQFQVFSKIIFYFLKKKLATLTKVGWFLKYVVIWVKVLQVFPKIIFYVLKKVGNFDKSKLRRGGFFGTRLFELRFYQTWFFFVRYEYVKRPNSHQM